MDDFKMDPVPGFVDPESDLALGFESDLAFGHVSDLDLGLTSDLGVDWPSPNSPIEGLDIPPDSRAAETPLTSALDVQPPITNPWMSSPYLFLADVSMETIQQPSSAPKTSPKRNAQKGTPLYLEDPNDPKHSKEKKKSIRKAIKCKAQRNRKADNHAELISKIAALASQNTNLQNENTSLKNGNIDLKAQYSNLETENMNLKSQLNMSLNLVQYYKNLYEDALNLSIMSSSE